MRRRLLALGALLVGLAACHWRTPDRPARAAGPDDDLTPPANLKTFYTSAKSCARSCHDLREPREDNRYPPVCRCTEYRIWKGEGGEPGDRHADASALLKSPRAADMARLLKWDTKPEDDPRCLGCHGFATRDKNVLDRPDEIVTEGVTCVVCHGATFEWVGAHHGNNVETKLAAWRGLSRRAKDKNWGMRDLWDPATRARLCASCHVGSAEYGRVLTHEMYAAGHPPLPGFEPAAFSESMRHWQYRGQKPEKVQSILGYRGEKERAQLVAVGAAVVFESSMRLLADEAKGCAEKGRSLDFARFDCAACHHDLRSDGVRQRWGYAGGAPGRPPAPAWLTALLRPTVACAEEFDPRRTEAALKTYEALAAELRKGLAARPFGKPGDVAPSAAKLADWAAALAGKAGRPIMEPDARRLLRALCDLPPGDLPDYDTARQIAWAVKMIVADLEPDSQAGEQRLAALDSQLRLTLPGGHKPTIVEQLDDALKARSRYDPKAFRERLADLSAAMR